MYTYLQCFVEILMAKYSRVLYQQNWK